MKNEANKRAWLCYEMWSDGSPKRKTLPAFQDFIEKNFPECDSPGSIFKEFGNPDALCEDDAIAYRYWLSMQNMPFNRPKGFFFGMRNYFPSTYNLAASHNG